MNEYSESDHLTDASKNDQLKPDFNDYFAQIDRSIKKTAFSIGNSSRANFDEYTKNQDYFDFDSDDRAKSANDDDNSEQFDSQQVLEDFDLSDEADVNKPTSTVSITDFYGLKAWTYDTSLATVSNQIPLGAIYIAKLFIEFRVRVSSLLVTINEPESPVDVYGGIYDNNGMLIAKTANCGNSFSGMGVYSLDFTEPLTLKHHSTIYLSLLVNGPTAPKLGSQPPSIAMQADTLLPLRAGLIQGRFIELPPKIALETASYSVPYFWLALR